MLIYAALLNWISPDDYHRMVQEDEWFEWTTFWAFIAAGVIFLSVSLQWRRKADEPGWFLFLVGLFCFTVAMEEISWGQRVLGFAPPGYFLENNFQQELNFHNVLSVTVRTVALRLAIIGYGVFLPMAAFIPRLRLLMHRLGIRGTPGWMIPSFAVTYTIVEAYPWKFSGEVAELMFAVSMAGSGIIVGTMSSPGDEGTGLRLPAWPVWVIALTAAAVLFLGIASSRWTRPAQGDDTTAVETAQIEIAAIGQDLQTMIKLNTGDPLIDCGLHKRLRTLFTQSHAEALRKRTIANRPEIRVMDARAKYFLDPWNLPYWIKVYCDGNNRRKVFVYSFGPNRRRDSTKGKIDGDDIGRYL